jgi:hypothetical protein
LVPFQQFEAAELEMAWFLTMIADDFIFVFPDHLGLAICSLVTYFAAALTLFFGLSGEKCLLLFTKSF